MNQVLLATDFKSTAAHSEWPDKSLSVPLPGLLDEQFLVDRSAVVAAIAHVPISKRT